MFGIGEAQLAIMNFLTGQDFIRELVTNWSLSQRKLLPSGSNFNERNRSELRMNRKSCKNKTRT